MALRSGYKGFKKLLGLKTIRPGTLAVDDAALANTFFPRSEQAVLGAVNIFKNVATSRTENGVTLTVNTDGTVSVTTGEGSATADTTLVLAQNIYIPSGHDWYLKGCPQGGSASTYFIYLDLNASPYTKYAQDFGDGSLIQNYVQTNSICYLRVRSGVSIPTPIIFKPQITTSLDTPYAPYAMTNKELTEKVHGIINAATNAADFAAFKTAMGAITPVTRSLRMEVLPEEPAEVIEEKPTTKRTTKKSIEKEGE